MTKIAYNSCFGGFSLSHDAIMRYGEIKGLTLYPEKEDKFGLCTYWTVPKDQRIGILKDHEFHTADMDARKASNEAHAKLAIYDRDIARDDPALVRVIEEMGEAANGMCANLQIAEVAKGEKYRIDEYDGNESVMTSNDYEWQTAH